MPYGLDNLWFNRRASTSFIAALVAAKKAGLVPCIYILPCRLTRCTWFSFIVVRASGCGMKFYYPKTLDLDLLESRPAGAVFRFCALVFSSLVTYLFLCPRKLHKAPNSKRDSVSCRSTKWPCEGFLSHSWAYQKRFLPFPYCLVAHRFFLP